MKQLTSTNRCTEDIGIVPIIIAELELGHVKRQVLRADLVISADDAALEDRPETLNRVGVDCTHDVLALGVIDLLMGAEGYVHVGIACGLVSAEQADLVRDHFEQEDPQGLFLDVLDYSRDHIAVALQSPGNGRHAGSRAATTPTLSATALAFVAILGLPADPGFVGLDNTDELLEFFIGHRGADFVGHIECGFVGTETHRAVDLVGTHALLAGHHHVDDAEPLPERLVGVLKNGSGEMGEPIARPWRARVALPLVGHRSDRVSDQGPAARAKDFPVRPTVCDQVVGAGILAYEKRVELCKSHLMDTFPRLSHFRNSLEWEKTSTFKVTSQVPDNRPTCLAASDSSPDASSSGTNFLTIEGFPTGSESKRFDSRFASKMARIGRPRR